MSEENKALFRRFMDEVVNGRNFSAIDDLMETNYVEHSPPPPGVGTGTAGMKQILEMFTSAFPDMRSTIDELIAEDDKVVGIITTTGTHRGEFMGNPASGKQINLSEIHVVRIVNGKAVEHWGLQDQLSLMQQIGAMPSG